MRVIVLLRPLAEARGLTKSDVQIGAQLTMPLVRRYWYSTGNGSEHGSPLQDVKLDVIGRLAHYLQVEPGDLIGWAPAC